MGNLVLSVGSASAALARAATTRDDFRCTVEVTDEQGRPVSASELEKFAEADRLAGTAYQLYFLTLAGKPVRREEFELLNDQEALEHAKQFVDGLALELWSGARLVGRLDPAGKG